MAKCTACGCDKRHLCIKCRGGHCSRCNAETKDAKDKKSGG